MNANRRIWTALMSVVSGGAVVLAMSVPASAQVQTQQSVSEGTATQKVVIERGEVVWVSGNNLMVKGDDGQLRYFPNVPNTARAMVGGKELGVTDLKPGMKLERTTIVTSTPRTIRTVRSVTGTVWNVTPPNSVILTMPNKENQRFTIPRDQKFLVDGKETDAFGLRPGMRISASAVSETADQVVTKTVSTTGVAPPPPPPPAPPPPNVALLIIEAPAPAPVATSGAPAQLPSTGSPVPLIGLLGLALCGASAAIRMLRKS
jgi:hypothetical protein